MEKALKIEIWSDIMCPFCYIGKRNLEQALERFEDRNLIEIEWKSFQLDPTIPEDVDPKTDVYTFLADRKGISMEQSKQMHEHVVQLAKNAGLDYRFDKAVVANSLKAHRMIQLAKTKGLGDAAEERLFSAYFTEGMNFGDVETLKQIGSEIGLSEADVSESLSNETYLRKVEQDIVEAQQIGVRGVPFFVFNRKFAVSGAQPVDAFVGALEQSVADWKSQTGFTDLSSNDGESCSVDGECE